MVPLPFTLLSIVKVAAYADNRQKPPMLEEREIQCPYCWESFTLLVDPSEGDEQSFVYDCEVCCRPIDVVVRVEGEEISVRTKQGREI
jgi:hypothetical protein